MSERQESTEPAVERLLVGREAAAILAVSERTLWELTKRGVIECVRVGRSVRYSRAALAAFIERGGAR
jgi:excisionase family DNA binding protein